MRVDRSPEVLASADELANALLRRVPSIRFGIAESPSEREAVFRLRYEVVLDRGWARPEDLPDGKERDSYDDEATLIVGWEGLTLAAAARLIFPSPRYRLPTEAVFDVEVEPRGQVADMGRQIVARAYSDIQHRVFVGLLARTWLEARSRGATYVCGDFSASMTRLYRRLGFELVALGPGRQYWEEERFPLLVDVAASVPKLSATWGAVGGS